MIYPQFSEMAFPSDEAIIYFFLPLVPILFFVLNRNRKSCARTWREQISVTVTALRGALVAESSLWMICILSAMAWFVCFKFWPLPQPFDAANATKGEAARVFIGIALLAVWFGGGIVAGVKTLIRAERQLECK